MSVTEHFTPSSFLSTLKNVINEDEKIALGVHFNVSPYAPFSMLSQFLYNFVLWGFFWDTASGEMDYPLYSVDWFIFMELNCAPEKDANYRRVSTAEQIIDSLPVLHLVANRNVNYKSDLDIDDNVKIVCSFIENMHLLHDKRSSRHILNFACKKEYRETLTRLFEVELPRRGIRIPKSQVKSTVLAVF